MSGSRAGLVGWVLVFCLMVCAVEAHGQDGAAGAAQDVGEAKDNGLQSTGLDAEALQEIGRLRAEVERLLSTVPPSQRERVRELLLAPLPSASPPSTHPPSASAPTTVTSGTPTGADSIGDDRAEVSEPEVPVAEVDRPLDPVTPVETAEVQSDEAAEAIAESTLEPSKRQGPTPQARRSSRRPACNTLDPLDENGDGKINAQDRYWRYLYVWVDQNRDGLRQDKEVESTYAAGVREIATELGIFYRKKGSVGEIRRGDALLLDLAGNGFGGGRRPDDGVLMVDTDGLGRGDGPKVSDASGAAVQGIEPFEAGWHMRLADGQVLAINCPRGGSN